MNAWWTASHCTSVPWQPLRSLWDSFLSLWHGSPTQHSCFNIVFWNLRSGYCGIKSWAQELEGNSPAFWTQLVLSGYVLFLIQCKSKKARFSWQHNDCYPIREDDFLKDSCCFLSRWKLLWLQRLCAVIVLPGLILSILRQETKHPEETIGSSVPICTYWWGGGGGDTGFFRGGSLCFLCLLRFHPVTLSPIFFEKSRCILWHMAW